MKVKERRMKNPQEISFVYLEKVASRKSPSSVPSISVITTIAPNIKNPTKWLLKIRRETISLQTG